MNNEGWEGEKWREETATGYFTGGPNGEISVQSGEGSAIFKLTDGKEIIFPEEMKIIMVTFLQIISLLTTLKLLKDG